VKFSRNELFEYRETLPDEVDTFPLTFPKFPIKRDETDRKLPPSSSLYFPTTSSSSSSHPFSSSEHMSTVSLSSSMQTTTTNPSLATDRPHIPYWLPPFPHPRTYKQTTIAETDPSQTVKLKPKRKRQSENGIFHLFSSFFFPFFFKKISFSNLFLTKSLRFPRTHSHL